MNPDLPEVKDQLPDPAMLPLRIEKEHYPPNSLSVSAGKVTDSGPEHQVPAMRKNGGWKRGQRRGRI